jgi:hypothetical protein
VLILIINIICNFWTCSSSNTALYSHRYPRIP